MVYMKLFIIGGDLRMHGVAELFLKEGIFVSGFGLAPHIPAAESIAAGVKDADAVLMGLPVSRDGKTVFAPFYEGEISYRDLAPLAEYRVPVLCGMPDARLAAQFLETGVLYEDYFLREELAVRNAIPTAEGAIMIAMQEMPITLHGAKCLITGFGRIGKYLAICLKALGASVTVAVRRESDLAWLEAFDIDGIRIASIKEVADTLDLLINTVPHPIIDETVLSRMQKTACIIDLASGTGGVDMESAKKNRLSFHRALSLPGKVAPKTAGAYIYKTVKTILEEKA